MQARVREGLVRIVRFFLGRSITLGALLTKLAVEVAQIRRWARRPMGSFSTAGLRLTAERMGVGVVSSNLGLRAVGSMLFHRTSPQHRLPEAEVGE
jgi:hypothetical protein